MSTDLRKCRLVLKIFVLLSIPYSVISCQTQWKNSRNEVGFKETRQLPLMGREMRQEFLLNENFIFLNHGSYGTYPKATQRALHAFQNRAEANPDLWMRREVRIQLDKVRAQLSALVNADTEDVVMIPNATSGINAIFRSLIFNLGERILHFSTVYGSMGTLIQFICDQSDRNVTSLVFNVTYPISNDELVAQFTTFLEQTHDPLRPIRIALIDHITSVPGAIVPIERIIPVLRQRGIKVLVDGAHAIGQIPIDIKELDPDYYITNCHKWLYAARGCALMFVKKTLQGTVHPAHIPSNYKTPGDFVEEFFWTGTMDYSPYLTVTAALEFRQSVGGEAQIREYNHNLAVQGGNYLATRYGTRVLQSEEQIGSMVDVMLPLRNHDAPVLTGDWWTDTLLYRYPAVYAAPYKHGGKWWARHSAQIYNDLSDFVTAGDTFIAICDEVDSLNGTRNGANFQSMSMKLATVSSALIGAYA